MKKYGKLILLTLFIISTVSVFYITGVMNEKNLPQFELHTVSGDEKIADDFVVTGMFGMTNYTEDLFRTEDKRTIYGRHTSFINREKLFYTDKKINKLQEDYRNFMRGKDYNLDAYYENDEKLVYGNIIYNNLDYKFEVDVLDKTTKKRISSFTHHIPNSNHYIQHAHTQLVNDELKIITINDVTSEDIAQEVHVYTFDLTEKTLINDETIASVKRNKHDGGYEYIEVINKANSKDSQIMLYIEQIAYVYSDEKEVSQHEEKVVDKKIVIYDLIDKTTEEIDLQAQFKNIAIPFYTDGESLYFGKTLINQLFIEKYDLQKRKVIDTLEIETNLMDVDHNNIIHANVIDNHLYYLPMFDTVYTEEPSVIVVDLTEMESIYEGFIRLEDGIITEEMYLYLDPLDIK